MEYRKPQDWEPGSFRDRRGRVVVKGDQILRLVDQAALDDWRALTACKFWQKNLAEKRVVETCQVDPADFPTLDARGWAGLLRHERIEPISYPYEWTFGMLKDAALLQLDLLSQAIEEDFVLRDSTPYNIQWQLCRPLFIDVPSFGRLDPGSPWLGYRQFCQMFLNPLLLQAHLGVPFQPWLRGSLDGIDPEVFRNLFGMTDIFKPGVFSHVLLQSSFEQSEKRPSEKLREEMRAAGLHKELVRSVVGKMHRLVSSLQWKPKESRWSGYTQARGYADEDLKLKEQFVHRVCQGLSPATVWDVGANDGRFSLIASEFAQRTLALDSDLLVLERLYQDIKNKGKQVLPLVFNFADPSPGLGWRGAERRALTARSKPDLILCLAVFHHLVISANIPLEDLLEYLRSLNCHLVVEFVTRQDPMVKALLLGKGEEFADYDQPLFDQWATQRFGVVEKLPLPSGTRVLYHLAPGQDRVNQFEDSAAQPVAVGGFE